MAIASSGSVFFAVIAAILIYIACAGEDTDDGFLGGFNADNLYANGSLLKSCSFASAKILINFIICLFVNSLIHQ